jgi:hypothetical protein
MYSSLSYNFEYMDVVTGGRDCPTNFNKHTLQLNINYAGEVPSALNPSQSKKITSFSKLRVKFYHQSLTF